jgi:pimeloyl-ACP methyl ester carboxylesterase
MNESSLRHRRVPVGSVTLHVVECGTGPTVLLLHGFPELWYAWHRLLPALARAGFRAVAPDLRGYGASDKPLDIDAYRSDVLVEDVQGLVHALDLGSVHLVGHDWGATIAFMFAARHPELVSHLVILNGAHPRRLREELGTLEQALRSSYILFFQLPWLPEWCLRRRVIVAKVFRGSSENPAAFSDDDIDRYTAAIRVPRAATGMVNYYRAARRFPPDADATIVAPTLVIWGERDPALARRNLDGLSALVPELAIVTVPNAGHFVHHEATDLVLRRMLEFLRAVRPIGLRGK